MNELIYENKRKVPETRMDGKSLNGRIFTIKFIKLKLEKERQDLTKRY